MEPIFKTTSRDFAIASSDDSARSARATFAEQLIEDVDGSKRLYFNAEWTIENKEDLTFVDGSRDYWAVSYLQYKSSTNPGFTEYLKCAIPMIEYEEVSLLSDDTEVAGKTWRELKS